MKFKKIALIMALGLISGLGAGFEGGSGTSGDPYQISTCQQLQDMENDLDAYYELVNDIDCSDTVNWNFAAPGGEGFEPVGSEHSTVTWVSSSNVTSFNGGLEGNSYTIENLYSSWSGMYNGLFAELSDGAIIKNLKVSSSDIYLVDGSEYGRYAGAIAGRSEGLIQNISVEDSSIVAENRYVGGVVGVNSGNGEIRNSKTLDVYVTTKGYGPTSFGSYSGDIGGIAGLNDAKIDDSYSVLDLELSGESETSEDIEAIGGISGRNSGVIEDSRFKGSITGTNNYFSNIGGLTGDNGGEIMKSYAFVDIDSNTRVGGAAGTNLGTINKSWIFGRIDGVSYVGGLVGYENSGQINDVYTSVDIYANSFYDERAGGLFGRAQSTNVRNSYSSGYVKPGSAVGGMIGEASSNTVINSYWDVNSSGQSSSAGGTGLTTSEMIGASASSNMAGFDFQDTWSTQSFYYPRLQWMEIGSGSESDPFMIYNCRELQALNNDLLAHYELANDIDCSDTGNWDGGEGFKPIGGSSEPFSGGLDGKSHDVKSLVIARSSDAWVGLFGKIDSTHSFTDFRILNVDINGDQIIGGLSGELEAGSITRVGVEGEIEGSSYNTGGLMGVADFASNLNHSYFKGTVTGDQDVGGFAGNFDGFVKNSFIWGNVSGTDDTGGFAGYSSGGRYVKSYSAADVKGPDSFDIRGFVGDHRGSGDDFEYAYWDKNVSGRDRDWGSIGLTTSQMTGEACDMVGFNEMDWNFFSSDYPQLEYFSSENISRECGNANTPEAPALLLPLDDSTQVPVKTNISVTTEGTGLQNITFYRNNSGSDTEIGTVTDVNASNSEIAQFEWSGLNTTTEYDWYAVAENSDGSVTSDTWSFTTEKNPWIENPRPDGSVVEASPELNLTVLEDVDPEVNVFVYDSEDNLIGSGAVNSGDRGSFSFNDGDEIGKTYEWYAVLETDSGLEMNSSASNEYPDYWNFTVVENFFRIDSTSEWLEGDFNGSAAWNDSDMLQTGYLSGEDETSTGGYEIPGLDSLVGQWRLNEVQSSNNVEDYSGVNNLGSVEGGASISPGLFSRDAVSFDGQDDYIDIPYTADYDLEAFTLSVWFKTSSLPEEIGVISNKQVDYNNRNWWLAIDNGQGVAGQDGGVALRTSSSGEIVTLNAQNDYRDGEWHHAVSVMDPQNNVAGLYIDGVLEDSEDQNVGAPDFQYSPIYLGMEVGSSDRFFDGQLSDHILVDKPLNASEVEQLYFNGKSSDYKASYTSKTVTELGAQEWGSLNISEVSAPDNTSINVTVEVSNDFTQGVDDSQTFELDGDLNQVLNLPDTREARIIFEGESQEIEKSWSINDVMLIYGDSSSTGINPEISPIFGDRVNMNSGSADIGKTNLEFEPWNPAQGVMETVNVDVDGVQAASFNDVPSNSTRSVDISTLGLSEDQIYTWSVSVEEAGLEVGSFNGEFSTHTVDIEATPQDDSHDSINLYYSEDGTSFKRLDSFSTSDSSPLTVKAANSELFSSDNHCYTAATSRSGLESSQSPEVCIGGDIP